LGPNVLFGPYPPTHRPLYDGQVTATLSGFVFAAPLATKMRWLYTA
jgi:hypothetical protein